MRSLSPDLELRGSSALCVPCSIPTAAGAGKSAGMTRFGWWRTGNGFLPTIV